MTGCSYFLREEWMIYKKIRDTKEAHSFTNSCGQMNSFLLRMPSSGKIYKSEFVQTMS